MNAARVDGRTRQRPFPLAPLLAIIPGTYEQRAVTLHVGDRRYARIVKRAALTLTEADTFAAAIGRHPCEIWGELWWQQAEQETA